MPSSQRNDKKYQPPFLLPCCFPSSVFESLLIFPAAQAFSPLPDILSAMRFATLATALVSATAVGEYKLWLYLHGRRVRATWRQMVDDGLCSGHRHYWPRRVLLLVSTASYLTLSAFAERLIQGSDDHQQHHLELWLQRSQPSLHHRHERQRHLLERRLLHRRVR